MAVIVGHKMEGGEVMFRARWEGYPPEEDTWEPESNLSNAPDVVNAYLQVTAHSLVTPHTALVPDSCRKSTLEEDLFVRGSVRPRCTCYNSLSGELGTNKTVKARFWA